jgi:taurine---2-oxoglutarate transaminase
MILDHSFDGAAKVFFTNGGTESVEHAVRMARLHTGRQKVLATYRSYHGGTSTSINLTGDPRRWPNDNGTSGVVHYFGPFLYRSVYHATSEEEECQRALESLENTILFEGPTAFAAIILETIPGTAGNHGAAPGLPSGRATDLRQVRHCLHRRRGHVRVRTHRIVVRLPETTA